MSDFVDRYEMELRLAAARHYGTRPLRARIADALRRRPWHTTGLVIAALATPAYAATQGWSPDLGSSERTRPTATAAGPPLEQVRLLSVLRRPQDARDRAPETANALRFLTKGVRGVRIAGIRALGGDPPVTLVPVTRYDPTAGAAFASGAVDDGLCLFVPDTAAGRPDGGGFTCASTDEVRAGTASLAVGRRVVVLVPDGVRRVDVRYATDAEPIAVRVSDNVAAFDAPADRPASATDFEQTWRGAGGDVVRAIPAPGGDLGATTDPRPAGRRVCSPLLSEAACEDFKSQELERP